MRIPKVIDEPALPPLEHPAPIQPELTLIPKELPSKTTDNVDAVQVVIEEDGEWPIFDAEKGQNPNQCPECGTESLSQRSVIYKNVWMKASQDGEDAYYWLCCFTYCHGNCEDENKPHIVLDSDMCDTCSAHPCECETCSYCGGKADSVCENCENCDNHCDCWSCYGCNSKKSDDDGQCSDCDNCESCCTCVYCENCESSSSSSSWCDDCEVCKNCCGGCTREREIRWPRRNQTLTVSSEQIDTKQWEDIDPAQSMADFYLLSYMEVVTPCADPEYAASLAALAAIAVGLRNKLVEKLDKPFQNYVDMAVGGEIRHQYDVRQSRSLSNVRERAWEQWPSIRAQLGPQALIDAAELFMTMGGSYGGAPWAAAANVLHDRITGTMPAWLFVDRIFTMQHHGGSLLNKIDWPKKTHLANASADMCISIGNAHSADSPNFEVLLFCASHPVKALFRQWWTARNRILIANDERPVEFPNSYDAISDKLRYLDLGEGNFQLLKNDFVNKLKAMQQEINSLPVKKFIIERDASVIHEVDPELEALLEEEEAIQAQLQST